MRNGVPLASKSMWILVIRPPGPRPRARMNRLRPNPQARPKICNSFAITEFLSVDGGGLYEISAFKGPPLGFSEFRTEPRWERPASSTFRRRVHPYSTGMLGIDRQAMNRLDGACSHP